MLAGWRVAAPGSGRRCGCAAGGAVLRSAALRRPAWLSIGAALPRRGLATTAGRAFAGDAAAQVGPQGLSIVGRTFLIIPVFITLSLGMWQVDRLAWKYEQIELRHQLLASAPSLIASARELLERWAELMPQRGGTEFAPYTLHGRFEHEKEVYIGVRGKPGAIEEGLGAGYSIVTPFVAQDPGGATVRVLVNRGWMPVNAKAQRAEEREQAELAAARPGAKPSAAQELRVVARKGERGASYMPAASFEKDRSCTWTDLATIANLVGATPSPPPSDSDDEATRAKHAATVDLPLYFDAVAAVGSDGGGAEAAANDATGGRKLHPMVAASQSAHAVDRYGKTTVPFAPFCTLK